MEKTKKCEVEFLPFKKIFTARAGYNLRQAIIDCGIEIGSACGGTGTCGRCKVKVLTGEVCFKGSKLISEKEKEEGFVLACLSRIKDDCKILIPDKKTDQIKTKKPGSKKYKFIKDKIYSGIDLNIFKDIKICPWIIKEKIKVEKPSLSNNTDDLFRFKKSLSDFLKLKNIQVSLGILKKLPYILRENNWEVFATINTMTNTVLNVQAPLLQNSKIYGIAVDIGTTTVALQLVDLSDGKLLATESDYNPQIKFGEDIINRIVYSIKNEGLKNLQEAVINNIDKAISLILKRENISSSNVAALIVAGNPTMLHIFYGIPPKSIREEPYITVANKFPEVFAKDLAINSIKDTMVFSIDGVASYLGGDITSGVLATNIYRKKNISLFIDLGTNGEIVAGNCDWMIGCSCSAGPAFEGGGVKCGTRALNGAIEKIFIDEATYKCSYAVIGDIKPAGICGSGLIDLIGEMYLKGVIDRKGKLNKEINNKYLKNVEGDYRYIIVDSLSSSTGEEIYISEVDINNLIRAKAAVYSGIKTLLEDLDLKINDIDKIFVAGGLGKNINVQSAIIIGMLPDINPDRFSFLGNTSLAGACMCLLSKDKYRNSEKIAGKITYLELSVNMNFMDRYIAGLFLPYTDLKDFPTVEKTMFGI